MADNFDPRFDPRFQPGYVPGPGRPKSDAVPLARRAPHPGEAEASAFEGVRDDVLALEAEPDPPVTPSETNASESDPPEPNPLERTLLVIGAVLVGGGVAVAYWANGLNYQYPSFGTGLSWQQLLQAAAWALSAPMVTAGLAIGVGILFRRAITWKPPE
ncbi:MAG TPA: hypothetical protein VFS93_00180 [Terrimesophilobacter sp.]|nr:hypothetical protein [Terrimesophilobacter sp.]